MPTYAYRCRQCGHDLEVGIGHTLRFGDPRGHLLRSACVTQLTQCVENRSHPLEEFGL